MSRKYKLVVFVPDSALEKLKKALFDAGAGKLGNYAQCSWQTKGLGQFCPLSGSDPFIGAENQLEQLEEWRLEMVLAGERLKRVVEALREAHPYEEPAFDITALVDPDSEIF
jgi:hypothetical protein